MATHWWNINVNATRHSFRLWCATCPKPRAVIITSKHVNTSRPRQNGRDFADDTFTRIFLNENVRISINISLKFVPKVPIDNIPSLVQIMAWRRPGDTPLSEPMMVRLLTHICVTRPQCVKQIRMLFMTGVNVNLADYASHVRWNHKIQLQNVNVDNIDYHANVMLYWIAIRLMKP